MHTLDSVINPFLVGNITNGSTVCLSGLNGSSEMEAQSQILSLMCRPTTTVECHKLAIRHTHYTVCQDSTGAALAPVSAEPSAIAYHLEQKRSSGQL